MVAYWRGVDVAVRSHHGDRCEEEQTGGLTRAATLVTLMLLGTAGAGAVHAGGLAPACAEASASYHVALVVEHADGEPTVRSCITLGAPSASAQEVLRFSNVAYGFVDEGSNGRAVCQVQHEPGPPPGGWTQDNCFTGSGGNVGSTWSIFCTSPWQHAPDGSGNPCYTSDGSWQYSSHGISSLQLRDGDAVGFRYESSPGRPASPAGICPHVAGDRPPNSAGAGASPPAPPGASAGSAASGGSGGQPVTAANPLPGGPAGQAPGPSAPPPGRSPAEPPGGTPPAMPATDVQALGLAPTPGLGAPAHPSVVRADGGRRWLGPAAAAAAALVLLGALGVQLVLPRVRP